MIRNSLARQVIAIAALSLVAAVLTAWLHPLRPPWYRVAGSLDERWRIAPEGVAALRAEGASLIWVDARPRADYESGHREGAILLNLEEWNDLMFQQMDALQMARHSPVLVYGGDERAAAFEVAKRLRELLGLDPVFVVEGDWREIP